MRKSVFASAALLALISAAPAHAQAWIGQIAGEAVAQQQEAACMSGRFPQPPEERLAPIRDGANAAIAQYLALASASESSDVSAAFSRRRSRTWEQLSSGEVTSDTSAINDPLARTQGATVSEALSLFQSGDRATVAGLWAARDSADNTIGYYRAVLRRERREWVLLHLDVSADAASPPRLLPYCHQSGDLDAVLQTSLEAMGPETDPAATEALAPVATP